MTPFGRRHAGGVAAVRLLVGLWLIFLGTVMCAYGYWWGLALLAVAGVVLWLAYNGRQFSRYGRR